MTQATTSDRPLPVTSGRRRRRFGLAAAALGAALIGSTAAPTDAEAAVPRVLRPGTRPMQFLFGLGPSWGIGGSSHYYGYGAPGYYGCGGPGFPCRGFGGYGSFKLTQEFNGHFSGNASGPALGILLNEEFGGYGRFGFIIAPKFTYDIQPKKDLGLYISPNVSLGYHLLHHRYWGYGEYYSPYAYNYHGANLQFGVGLKLMLDDRWIVWLQFPQFDMTFGGAYGYNCANVPGAYCPGFFVARLNLLAGGGVSF